jgi:flagellar hook-associated protein 2
VTINFSGLATGLDTAALVDQLVALERVPANKLAGRKSDAGRRQSIVSDLITKLTALKTARTSLDTPSEVRAVTASSSDPKVVVTGSGSAQPGQLAIRVGTLARTQTSVSTPFASATDAIGGAGTLGIKLGAADEVPIAFTSTDTLTTIAQRINEEMDGVRADVIDNGSGTFQLSVSSEETGTANAITFTEAGQPLGFLAEGSTKVAASNATFTMNGISMTRATNTITDAVAGLTLSLTGTHAIADSDAVVSVARDPAAVEAKVKSLVDAFNAVSGHVSSQLSYNGVQKGGDTLFGDSTLRSLQRGLSGIVNQSYPHGEGTTSLAQLGIRLDRTGTLSIDSARFAAAMTEDPTALESVLTGTESFGAALDKMVTSYTQAGDGFLSAKKASLTKEMSRYDDEIERIETRASRLGDQLTAQFTKLEALISSMQSQSAALTKVFG